MSYWIALGAVMLAAAPAITEAQSRHQSAAAVQSVSVRLVNRGLLPVHLEIAGNRIRVGSFSHAVVGFPVGTEVRLFARGKKGKLVHVIQAADRDRDIRVS